MFKLVGFLVIFVILTFVESYKDLKCKDNEPEKLCTLEEFGLSDKNISDVTINTTKTNINQVVLRNISVDYLPISIKTFPKIVGISIDNCGKFGLNNLQFKDVGELKNLTIINNGINILDANSFKDTPTAEILNLEHNQIGNITKLAFNGLIKLQELKLTQNLIGRLELGLFDVSKDLKRIDLSQNHISKIFPFVFDGLPLESLDLSGNSCINKKWEKNFKLGELYEELEKCLEEPENEGYKNQILILKMFYQERQEKEYIKRKIVKFFIILGVSNLVPLVIVAIWRCRKKKVLCFRNRMQSLNSTEILVNNNYA